MEAPGAAGDAAGMRESVQKVIKYWLILWETDQVQ
jgi:hypothetical protein